IRSPGCQSRRPTKSKPWPWNLLRCSPIVNSRIRRMISTSTSVRPDRLTNGSTSCSRVLMNAPAPHCHENTKTRKPKALLFRAFALSWQHGRGYTSRYRDALDDVSDDAVGRQPMARRVRPQPDAVAEDVNRQVLDILRIDT